MDGEKKEEKNGWALLGLALGVLSIFFATIGIVPLSGVIVNIVGISRAKKYNGKGKTISIIGLILSIIFTLVYLNNYGYI